MRSRKERRLDAAFAAADLGDMSLALTAFWEFRKRAWNARARKTVVWAAVAVGGALKLNPEPSPESIANALECLDLAIEMLPNIDQDVARQMRLHLLDARITASALSGDQDTISRDIGLLEVAWNDLLFGDAHLRQALFSIPGGLSVTLGAVANSGWVLLSVLRLAEARRLLDFVLKVAEDTTDVKVGYISSVLLAEVARLTGDASTATRHSASAKLLLLKQHQYSTPLPIATGALLSVMLALVDSWIKDREGAFRDARMTLEVGRKRLGPRRDDAKQIARRLISAHEINYCLEIGDLDHADALLSDEIDEMPLDKVGGIALIGALVGIRVLRGDLGTAADHVEEASVLLDGLVPAVLIFPHLGSMALACAISGKSILARDCLQLAIAQIHLLSSGNLGARERLRAQQTHLRVRDSCLIALTHLKDEEFAPRTVLAICEAWREQTLRSMLTRDSHLLSGDNQRIVDEMNGLLVGKSETDSAVPGVDLRLKELREALAEGISTGYAALCVPQSLSPRHLAMPKSEIWISAALTRDLSGNSYLVSVVTVPGESPLLRCTQIPADCERLLSAFDDGLDFLTPSEVHDFHREWASAEPSLFLALGLDVVLALDVPETMEVRVAVDSGLINLPVHAIGDGSGPVASLRTLTRVPFLGESHQHSVPVHNEAVVTRVLANVFSEAESEIVELRRLHQHGQIELTEVPSLGHLWAELNSASYDVLVMSAHGDGSGLEYALRDYANPREVLYVHDLLQVRLPRWVVAASCFSGSGGSTDITGLIATLLTHGADEVISAAWAIPSDATAELLGRLFQLFGRPGSLASKLGQAQREYRLAYPHHHSPYWWAGLVTSTRPSESRLDHT